MQPSLSALGCGTCDESVIGHGRAAQSLTGSVINETIDSLDLIAYALASIAVDFRVAEAVDAVQMVYGAIPKKIFKTNPEYWKR